MVMKKYTPLILIPLLCALFVYPNVALAQKLPSSPLQSTNLEATFEEMGFVDFTLHSPFDSNNVRFTIPPNWQFGSGGEIVLNYDILLSGADVIDESGNQREFGGNLSILFNRQLVDILYIERSGSYTISIAVPDSALVSLRSDGRHELAFELSASESCEFDIRTSVTIKRDSYFNFPLETFPPNLDLTRIPYPFYPVSTFVPNQTIFVIPTSPEIEELKAAMNLFSGFGGMTNSDFLFNVVTAEELTDELLSSGDLVFVGKPDKFDMLSEVEFPQPVSDGQFSNLSVTNAEDGIIQFAYSPWNPDKAILLVSGGTAEAVNKSAQAISTGEIFTATDPKIVFVSAVHPFENPLTIVESFSFRDLGYRTETFRGFGTRNVNINFFLPREQVNSTEASLDLRYLSSLYTVGRDMSIAINLNGGLISTIDIISPTDNLHTNHIDIPPGLLRFGENRMEIQVTLLPTFSCDPGRLQDHFVTILDDSVINIPATPTPISKSSSVDLSFYPNILLTTSDLSDITFILPQSSPTSWKVASQLALSLGNAANPGLSTYNVVYGDDVPQEILDTQNLIIVGRASTLPVVNELNDILPAPFDLATDTASEGGLQVSYRMPPETSLGYLELVNSPFVNDKVILLVSGNTDDGVQLAGNALTLSGFRSSLAGQFAVTNGNQLVTTKAKTPLGQGVSLGSIIGTVVPGSEPIINTPIPAITQPNQIRPIWLLPVFIISAILVVFLLIRYIFNLNTSRKANIDLEAEDEE